MAQHQSHRAFSLTDSMDVQRDALQKLSALEAEIILLPMAVPESTRCRLIQMVANVQEEFLSALATIRVNASIQPLSRKDGSVGSLGLIGSSGQISPAAQKAVRTGRLGCGDRASPRKAADRDDSDSTSRQRQAYGAQSSTVTPKSAPSPAANTVDDLWPTRSQDRGDLATPPDGGPLECSPSEHGDTMQSSTNDAVRGQTSQQQVLTGSCKPPQQHRKSTKVPSRVPAPPSGYGRPTSSPHNASIHSNSNHFLESVYVPPPPSSYGHCLTAALYMTLEALLVGCEAERLSLYTKTSRGAGLELAVAVGAGVPPAKKGVQASPVGLAQAVFATQIAANLDTVTYEDVAECPGPTAAKNALLFPVVHTAPSGLREAQGVIVLINKRHGAQAFDKKDEHLLHTRLPVLSYQLWHYPIEEYALYAFDPAPLHRLAPLPSYAAPSIGIPRELSDAPDHVQRVFHRNGTEKFIRKQALLLTDDIVMAPSTAESLTSVEAYISVLEDCWKRGIHDRIEVELTLRQKMQHLSDAREILVRKQKKFDILKETFCEQLENNLSAGTGGGGLGGDVGGSGRAGAGGRRAAGRRR